MHRYNLQDVSSISFHQTYTYFSETNFILGTSAKMKYNFAIFKLDNSLVILALTSG